FGIYICCCCCYWQRTRSDAESRIATSLPNRSEPMRSHCCAGQNSFIRNGRANDKKRSCFVLTQGIDEHCSKRDHSTISWFALDERSKWRRYRRLLRAVCRCCCCC